MGFLFDSGDSRSSDLIEEQLRQSRLEMAQKSQSLYKTRLDIIKSQGNQIWEPMTPNVGIGQGKGGGKPSQLEGLAGFAKKLSR